MKVRVGFVEETWGTIEVDGDNLKLEGDTPILGRVVEQMQGDLSAQEFVETLPSRMRSYSWAVVVDD